MLKAKVAARELIPKAAALNKRFDKFKAQYMKWSDRLNRFSARVEALKDKGGLPEEKRLEFDKFIALLNGSHRVQALVLPENKE